MLMGAVPFLSTPSARRATGVYQNVHLAGEISIHALCEEGDSGSRSMTSMISNFYPRPLRGGRPIPAVSSRAHLDFYPRPLRGGRPSDQAKAVTIQEFLSTPSARRATVVAGGLFAGGLISIHALCEEGDVRRPVRLRRVGLFLSTPSARRATPAEMHL